MLDIQPNIMQGKFIQLEPLHHTHKEELYNIAQDERIWTFSAFKAFGQDFAPWFDKSISLLSRKEQIPFIARCLNSNKIVGSTRFYNIALEHHRLTIGYTWFIPEVWGTSVNPEAKLLLLSFAFENCSMNRVEFMIDTRNLHSRAAIKKLGAKEEGILRQHIVLKDGYIRDTVVYSIIKADWPEVKAKLMQRLNAN